jgi:predicted GH43/DUF377 family glycosyl hydrolase
VLAADAMIWRKCGLVYRPSGERWWARQYATIPTVQALDERTLRVYFAALDELSYGRIGFVDLDARDPTRILAESLEPVLDLGEPGAFDDCGVNPSCTIMVRGETFLYYIGWQRCERVPYMLFSGLASSVDHRAFRRASRVPILDRTAAEPFSRSAPFVLPTEDGFRMWYWSCLRWSQGSTGLRYNNVIRHASSTDGVNWQASEKPCLEPDWSQEHSLGRPWVLWDGSTYRMWFSVRSESQPYRFGYAESSDGLDWVRNDAAVGIGRSETGWDSEMVCYPCVVDVAGRRYLFYNGNRHGATGFGCAILEQD